MLTTPYFDRTRNPQTGHVSKEIALEALAHEAAREEQGGGRVAIWGFAPTVGKFVRVITVDSGRALLNAFIDDAFTKGQAKGGS